MNKEKTDYQITKDILLNTLLDMDSLYFDGIWRQIMGLKSKPIKTLWNQN